MGMLNVKHSAPSSRQTTSATASGSPVLQAGRQAWRQAPLLWVGSMDLQPILLWQACSQ